MLVSALNESPDRIGLRYARKVFLDGFLRHRRGFEIELPAVPLGRLYGAELLGWLANHGVDLQMMQGVKQLQATGRHVDNVQLRQGTSLCADWYISAVPFDRLLDLLPAQVVDEHAYFANLKKLETSPITSVHCWFDRPVLERKHVVLVDGVGQWVFNRGDTGSGEHYVQVVVSAARQFRGLRHEQVQERVIRELRKLFPEGRTAQLLRAGYHRASSDLQRRPRSGSLAARAVLAIGQPFRRRRLDRDQLARHHGGSGA